MKLNDNNKYFKDWYYKLSGDDRRLNSETTKKEVFSIKKILNLPKDSKILDLASGHGRHSLLMADYYQMTALDNNDEALNKLRVSVRKQKKDIRIVKSDMRNIPFTDEFDAVIIVFNSFGYFRKDEDNLKVIKSAYRSLKKGGLFLLDLRNKNMVLKNTMSRGWMREKEMYILNEYNFSLDEDIEEMKVIVIDQKAKKISETGFISKLYSHKKLEALLKKEKFKIVNSYGDLVSLEKYIPSSSRRYVLVAKK